MVERISGQVGKEGRLGLSLEAVSMEVPACLHMERVRRGLRGSNSRRRCARTGSPAARASGGTSASGLMVERISGQVGKEGRGRLVEGEDQGDQQLGLAVMASTKQSSVPSGVRVFAHTEQNACLPMAQM